MSIIVGFVMLYGLAAACVMVYELHRAPLWDSEDIRSQ
jgi:hypothetical protein